MGRVFAQELSNSDLELEKAIGYHLRGNHYPPVPLSMVKPCIEAISAGWDEDWDLEIAMPEGITYKGKPTAPAWAIIEQHHLDSWIESDDD